MYYLPGQIQSPLGILAIISTFPYRMPFLDLSLEDKIGFRYPCCPSLRQPYTADIVQVPYISGSEVTDHCRKMEPTM